MAAACAVLATMQLRKKMLKAVVMRLWKPWLCNKEGLIQLKRALLKAPLLQGRGIYPQIREQLWIRSRTMPQQVRNSRKKMLKAVVMRLWKPWLCNKEGLIQLKRALLKAPLQGRGIYPQICEQLWIRSRTMPQPLRNSRKKTLKAVVRRLWKPWLCNK
eukprot:s13864_g1.t1